MRFWWKEPSGVAGRSRPRVAHAVVAARLEQAGVRPGLGSAGVDVAMLRSMEAVERAAVSGPLRKSIRRRRQGLTPELLWATARAARESHRTPEEVWTEALQAWLTQREAHIEPLARPVEVELKRHRAWAEIEETLDALRAS